MLIEIRDIEYDVDSDDDDATEMEILSALPKTLLLHVEDSELDDYKLESSEQYPDVDDYQLDDYLSDYISDKTGFCHKGFDYEIIAT